MVWSEANIITDAPDGHNEFSSVQLVKVGAYMWAGVVENGGDFEIYYSTDMTTWTRGGTVDNASHTSVHFPTLIPDSSGTYIHVIYHKDAAQYAQSDIWYFRITLSTSEADDCTFSTPVDSGFNGEAFTLDAQPGFKNGEFFICWVEGTSQDVVCYWATEADQATPLVPSSWVNLNFPDSSYGDLRFARMLYDGDYIHIVFYDQSNIDDRWSCGGRLVL
jgi:hypothetical protein